MQRIRSHTRPIVAALAGAALQVALSLPVADWQERVPGAAPAAGIALAVLAGALGGIVPGLLVAAAGWTLQLVLLAETTLGPLVALPAWLAAGAAAGWAGAQARKSMRARSLAETRLAAVAEAAADAIVGLRLDGTIATWSAGAAALYGYAEEEARERSLADLLAGEDGERRAARLLDAVRTGYRAEDVGPHRRRDGSEFPGVASLAPTGRVGTTHDALLVARDVGELRRTTERLREVEARYRSLTEHLPVVTYLRSPDGDRALASVSPQVDRLLGYAADEWLADPGLFLRLVHPDDRERVAAEHAAAPEPGERARSEYRLVSRDGRVVWVRDESTLVLDRAGRPLCVQGFLLDVSERQAAADEQRRLRAEQEAAAADARDRQRLIEFLAEAGGVLAASLDFRTTIRHVASRATRDLADWCVVDVVEEGNTVLRLAAEKVEPATPVPAPAADPEPEVLDLIRMEQVELSESRIRVPLVSSRRRAVGLLTLLAGPATRGYRPDDLSWAQTLASLIALAYDSARLHQEVEARADANRVLTYVADGVFLLDRSGTVRLWNPAAEELTGIPAARALGKAAADAIPGWHELSERVPVGAAGEPVQPETLPLDTDRGERWLSISGVEFFGGTVYAFRDITEAHRLDELQAGFIATASHELRTPLAAVYGAAQTLRRHDFALDDAGRERFISLIVDESDRLGRIVNQILLANQLDVGRLDLVTEPFDASDLLERVVEAARTHAPPGITFEIRADDGVPLVAADKDRSRQILVNLVENAIKYSPDGGRIELGVEPAGDMVLFRVLDEGLGIPQEEQPRIFEKFYRLDPEMTKGIGGTGLGLYICSELVERMDGRIWVESRDVKGSAFFFELPSVGPNRVLPRPREASGTQRAA